VFKLNPAGLNWPRAVLFLDVALVPLVIFWAIGYEQYLLSALFGLLFSWLIDPGGSFAKRAARIAGFGLIGAGLTALGFGIGGDAWGWLVLAASAVTLVAGLMIVLGVHRFVAAMVLNLWFIVALAGIQPSSAPAHHQLHVGSDSRLGRRVGAVDRRDVPGVADPRARGPAAADGRAAR
jgi:hypothetical protein